jgi:YD repeat-containing protein
LNCTYTNEFDEEGGTSSRACGVPARRSGCRALRTIHQENFSKTSRKILKDEWGNIGEPTIESVYTYDNQGRLLKVTNSAKPDNPVTFQYDHRGRKTKLQASRPEDYRPNSAHAGSPFEVADSPPNLDGGGSATTFYDGQDRPTEVHGFLLAITSPGTTISQGLTLICGR